MYHTPNLGRKKVKSEKRIVRCIIKQDTEFRNALKSTGSKEIQHTVADTFWGTGGTDKSLGENSYGKVLEDL